MKNNKINFFCMIICISILLNAIFSVTLKADIGEPLWDAYYAWITNKNGIEVTDREGKKKEFLPYGSRIYVWNGGDGVTPYSVTGSYMITTASGFSSWNVKGRFFEPLSKDPDGKFLTNEEHDLIASDDVIFYTGPSEDYKKVETITRGTIFKTDYNDGMWAHVKVGENSGWVYFRQVDNSKEFPSVFILGEKELYVEADKSIYSKIGTNDGDKTNNEQAVECNYYYIDKDGREFANIIYQGKNVWILTQDTKIYNVGVEKENVESEDDLTIKEKLDQVPNPIVYCLFGATAAALTSFILIKILNKKSN